VVEYRIERDRFAVPVAGPLVAQSAAEQALGEKRPVGVRDLIAEPESEIARPPGFSAVHRSLLSSRFDADAWTASAELELSDPDGAPNV
jgi:hypothetical protein